MTRDTRIKIANYVLFQVGWLACVWGAAAGYPWMSLVAFIPTLLLHLGWATNPLEEAKLIGVCAFIGVAFDGLLLATGWVSFPNGEWIPGLAPYWMMILWLFMGTTLNLSMSWMKGRPSAAFVLGAIGGPLAYLAGERLGGITLINTSASLIALAIGWGVVMPILAAISQRLNGFRQKALPDFFIAETPKNGVTQHG